MIIEEENKGNDKRTGTFQDKNNSGGKFRLGQNENVARPVHSRTAENGGASLADQLAMKKSHDKKVSMGGGVQGMESSLFKK